MRTRYASWGSDKTYRWLWRAALQDAIFAFKNRLQKVKTTDAINAAMGLSVNNPKAKEQDVEIY